MPKAFRGTETKKQASVTSKIAESQPDADKKAQESDSISLNAMDELKPQSQRSQKSKISAVSPFSQSRHRRDNQKLSKSKRQGSDVKNNMVDSSSVHSASEYAQLHKALLRATQQRQHSDNGLGQFGESEHYQLEFNHDFMKFAFEKRNQIEESKRPEFIEVMPGDDDEEDDKP